MHSGKITVLFIVPGSGDLFYCGNCIRDNLYANALRKSEHNVIIMPLYLPLTFNTFKADTPLFFPATSYFTALKFFRKSKIPRFLERLLNSRFMLRMAASFSGSTSPKGLEEMTFSMISGEGNAFNNQMEVLIDWIKNHETPDVIHLSSSLLMGVAKTIKQQLSIPIVCSLQDEEVWIDQMAENDSHQAWNAIRENMHAIDRFVTTSQFYKNTIAARIPQLTDIDVIYPGIDIAKYAITQYPENPVVGFFYRMNQLNGLDVLADAFVFLKNENRIPNLKLKIGGGYSSADNRFVKKVRKKLSTYWDDVDWIDTYNLDEHAGFYRDISVICVPITFDEGVGIYLCEAFAAGRPAVEPNTGSFDEIVADAGVLYSPNTAIELAEALEKLLTNNELLNQCRENAKHLSETRYSDKVAAEKLIDLYQKTLIN